MSDEFMWKTGSTLKILAILSLYFLNASPPVLIPKFQTHCVHCAANMKMQKVTGSKSADFDQNVQFCFNVNLPSMIMI